MIRIAKKRKIVGVGGLAPPPVELEQKEAELEKRKVVFVLEKAQLETARIGSQIALLNADDHKNYLNKHQKDVGSYRPDILHQSLLAILDSPLCKSGCIQSVFIRTERNVLIQVDPATKLPRTFGRFSGLLAQLLEKFGIRASSGAGKLLKCVKGPVTNHLPGDAQIFALSREGAVKKKAKELVGGLDPDRPVVFIVGAFAHGHFKVDYTENYISISDYPLSAACCLSKLTNALEDHWDIA